MFWTLVVRQIILRNHHDHFTHFGSDAALLTGGGPHPAYSDGLSAPPLSGHQQCCGDDGTTRIGTACPVWRYWALSEPPISPGGEPVICGAWTISFNLILDWWILRPLLLSTNILSRLSITDSHYPCLVWVLITPLGQPQGFTFLLWTVGLPSSDLWSRLLGLIKPHLVS